MAHRTTLAEERPTKTARAGKKLPAGPTKPPNRTSASASSTFSAAGATSRPISIRSASSALQAGRPRRPLWRSRRRSPPHLLRHHRRGLHASSRAGTPPLDRRAHRRAAIRVDQQKILERLIRADLFEQVLQSRYLGTKRFSLEGVTALIPLLDSILDTVGEHGALESVMAMSHRGRLNVMVHAACKPPHEVVAGFEDVDRAACSARAM